MRILIDGDACPVVKITENVAKRYKIECEIFCDTAHIIKSDYSRVTVTGQGADAVDFRLINACERGDIVVTQDYGVASMTLGKGCFAIHQSGKWYTEENITGLLSMRHISREARRSSSKNHIKGPKKRTAEDDENFRSSLIRLIEKIKELPETK